MTVLLEDDVVEERCKNCGHAYHCAEHGAECECRLCECAECGDLPRSAQWPFPYNTRP
jgi:hypothetical protein